MIHNLKTAPGLITFTVITEVGKCDVKVNLDEFTIGDDRPHLYIIDYEILGQKADTIFDVVGQLPVMNPAKLYMYEAINALYSEGLRRISAAVSDICDNNGWKMYSY